MPEGLEDLLERVVAEWLGEESEFAVVSVVVDDEDVSVVLAGPGEPPAADTLASDLVERIGGPIRLDLQWIPRIAKSSSPNDDRSP